MGLGKWDIEIRREFALDNEVNKKVSFLQYQHSIIPLFPGPDLACRASIPWAPLRKPYSDRKVFHAIRARAGHYSMYEA